MRSAQVLAKGDHIAILREGHLTIEQQRVVTTEDGPAWFPRWAVRLGVVGFLGAYTAYVRLTGAAHGTGRGSAAFAAVPGLFVGGLGVVRSAVDRALSARRGVTVVATRACHPNGKRASHYRFTDVSGNELTTHYGSGRVTDEIHVAYDPGAPSRRHAASEPAYVTVVKHALGLPALRGVLSLGLWGALASLPVTGPHATGRGRDASARPAPPRPARTAVELSASRRRRAPRPPRPARPPRRCCRRARRPPTPTRRRPSRAARRRGGACT